MKAGAKLCRDTTTVELFRNRLHFGMTERAIKTISHGLPFAAGEHKFGTLLN